MIPLAKLSFLQIVWLVLWTLNALLTDNYYFGNFVSTFWNLFEAGVILESTCGKFTTCRNQLDRNKAFTLKV